MPSNGVADVGMNGRTVERFMDMTPMGVPSRINASNRWPSLDARASFQAAVLCLCRARQCDLGRSWVVGQPEPERTNDKPRQAELSPGGDSGNAGKQKY
jgi:hypothetical protein